MGELWGAALGSAAIGAATSLYGANKQAKATQAAQNASIEAQQESERQNWLRYLMTRGVNAGPNTQSGEIPGYAPGAALNTKLPLWMKVTPNAAGGGTFNFPTKRFRKIGSV